MIKADFEVDFDKLDEFIEKLRGAGGATFYGAPHAIYVEFDTEYESKPPFQPLYEWVQRNINTDDPVGTTEAIRTKIHQEGIEGVFFLSRAKASITDVDPYIERDMDFTEAPDTVIENICQDLLEKSNQNIEDAGSIDTGEMIKSGAYTLDVDPDEGVEIEEI